MLKKLIKYEWKNMYKTGSMILIAIFAVTLIGCILLQMPWFGDLFADESNLNEVQGVIAVFTMVVSFMVYIFMLVGATYGIMIYIAVRFYKTMYSPQGYLTNTLPVTPNQLLISKTLVGGIWYILVTVAVIISVLALICSFVAGIVSPMEGVSFNAMMAEMMEELVLAFETEMGGFMIHYCIFMVLSMIISPFCAVIMIEGALTIGQLSKKHKALMGILAYFGICFINMVISMIVQMVYTIRLSVSSLTSPDMISDMDMMGQYDVTLVIQVIMAAVLYWLSHYILTKKLNLE